MLRPLTFALGLALTSAAQAADIAAIVDYHILPGYQALAAQSDALATTARTDCAASSPALRAAYHDAFDAWVSVSHLRFGPSEVDQRAFALAFWPDPRGSASKTLTALITSEDPVIATPDAFATVSVAGRGFYALELLLYDDSFAELGSPAYKCALIQAMTAGIASNSGALLDDWSTEYAQTLRNAGQNDTFRSEEEALRQVFTALSTGLQFTSEARLGRPLGSFDRPRPNRAEARRSGRSLRHVVLSLEATRALTNAMSDANPALDASFEKALRRSAALDDPVFAGVAEPQSRLRVEVLQQHVDLIRERIAQDLGASLGIAAGFNALDGD